VKTTPRPILPAAALGLLDGLLLFFLPGASLGATTYEQRVIAAVIAGEAANQGRAGMVAVAEVIHQRVDESGWTPFRVVTHGNRLGVHAFSCLNRTTPPALVKKWHRDPAYETALKLAQLLCEAPEKLPDTTFSANFFTRVGEKPEWARRRNPVVVIKDHAFYRIPASAGARRAW
jgi:spore germination cell wall hydrolase CwlJ-like protein